MLNHRIAFDNGPRSPAAVSLQRVLASLCALALVAGGSGCSASSKSTVTLTTANVPDPGWIAYRFAHEGKAGIAMVRQDGTNDHPFLSRQGQRAHDPEWSADGTKLTWALDDSDGTTDIWIGDAKGNHRKKIVDCKKPCNVAEQPVWSPDGEQIAYWTKGQGQPQVIRIVDATTGAVTKTIAALSDLEGLSMPRWSPDGQQLVVANGRYVVDGDKVKLVDSAIGIIDLTASSPTVRLITAAGLSASYPDWSPTGDLIVFQAGNLTPFAFTGAPTNLFTIKADGTELTQITNRAADQPFIATPSWTPDGQTILVTLIRAAGEGPGGINRTLAALSADGNLLLDLLDPQGNAMRGFSPRKFARASP